MTTPFSDELVRYVAKALAAHANRGLIPQSCSHWSAWIDEAKVALLARKQFKCDRRAERLNRPVRDHAD